jgi:hypothetical protein
MPTITLTNNTTLNIAASSADDNGTLNRYLKDPLKFVTPAGFDAIAGQKVADVDPAPFPLTATATGEGKFAVEKTTLDVQLNASASLGLLKADDQSDFLKSLQLPPDPATVGIVSFQLQGKLSAGDTATVGDFCFGVTPGASVALTSFCPAAADDTLADAVKRSVEALTIPHDIADLKALPPAAICQVDAASSIKFSASVTYNVLNDPLATTSIAKLPSIVVNATAGATVEASVTHSSDHTVTVAKLPNGKVHLSVSVRRTDDFETSLTASAGVTAKVGSQDALAFLLGLTNPNGADEAAKLKQELPNTAQKLSSDIKKAIDANLCNALQVSLKASLDTSKSKNRVFLYEVDLTSLDKDSEPAVTSALAGDFTAITRTGVMLTGIRELDSTVKVTSKVTHSLAIHLLGIFNHADTNTFVKTVEVGYTKDTHEIVLSDQQITLDMNNLKAEKIRDVVLKGMTLTLPASANTPEEKTPINTVFFDHQADASPSVMRQWTNVLNTIRASDAAAASALLAQNLSDYGTSSLYLGLNLIPDQCRKLFVTSDGKACDWTHYLFYANRAQQTILAGDPSPVSQDRLKIYTAGIAFWQEAHQKPAQPDVLKQLKGLGLPEGVALAAVTDVITSIWWSNAMASYSTALVAGESLVKVGTEVVQTATNGFSEPWLVMAFWAMLDRPVIEERFTTSLQKRLAAGTGD